MQKVEKKHRGVHRGGRLLLFLAAVLLLAGSITAAVLLNRPTEEMLPKKEDHGGILVSRDVSELSSVSIARREGEKWTLIRTENGDLLPEAGGSWTVDTAKGDLLQEALTQVVYEEILTDNPADYRDNLEDFGLLSPLVTATARYTDGESITLQIGDKTGYEEGWYYMTVTGDDRLFAVSAGTAEDLNVEFALLRPVPKPEIYAALLDRITVLGADGEAMAEWRLQGQITDRDAGDNWAVTAPFVYPADEELIQNLKKNAEDLRLGIYTAPATEENLEKYGLKEPTRTLQFHMAEGSTGTVGESGVYDVVDHEEQTVTLRIGGKADDLADYVRFADEIFTVSHFTLSSFTDPKPLDTVARYPVLTPLNSLDSVTVEANGETVSYELDRTGETDPETAEEIIHCRRNGTEISYDAFAAAYERLLVITFSGKLPEGAKWDEPYQKMMFRTLSGGTHTVELSHWDGLHDAVTVDGCTLFYLIQGGFSPLPSDNDD